MLQKPENLKADYQARPNEEDVVILTWNAVAGAVSYKVHKNDDRYTFEDTTGLEDVYTVTERRFNDLHLATTMDLFYYVTAVDAAGVEGNPSDTITTIHPWLMRLIEQVDNLIADDFDDDVWILTPFQKKLAIDMALHYVNSEPVGTDFTYANFPRRWQHMLVFGGAAFCLKRQILLEKAKEMRVDSAGVSWQPPPMSDVIRIAGENWLDMFKDHATRVKRNFRPGPIGIGSMKTVYAAPTILKFRHLRAGRIF